MKLQIITPVKLVRELEIMSITLPTARGEITILPKHQQLLTLLRDGIVTYKTKTEVDSLSIGGGYAQTDGSVIRVLVSRAYGQDEIDEKLTEQAMQNAQTILNDSKDLGERAQAKTIMRRSIIDSKLIKRHRKISSDTL